MVAGVAVLGLIVAVGAMQRTDQGDDLLVTGMSPPATVEMPTASASPPQSQTANTGTPRHQRLTATFEPAGDSGVTGTAAAGRDVGDRWTVTIRIEGGQPNAAYSVIVVRTGGDPGTPGPTPCQFTTDWVGAGGCSGVVEGTELLTANVMGPTGNAVAHAYFA